MFMTNNIYLIIMVIKGIDTEYFTWGGRAFILYNTRSQPHQSSLDKHWTKTLPAKQKASTTQKNTETSSPEHTWTNNSLTFMLIGLPMSEYLSRWSRVKALSFLHFPNLFFPLFALAFNWEFYLTLSSVIWHAQGKAASKQRFLHQATGHRLKTLNSRVDSTLLVKQQCVHNVTPIILVLNSKVLFFIFWVKMCSRSLLFALKSVLIWPKTINNRGVSAIHVITFLRCR